MPTAVIGAYAVDYAELPLPVPSGWDSVVYEPSQDAFFAVPSYGPTAFPIARLAADDWSLVHQAGDAFTVGATDFGAFSPAGGFVQTWDWDYTADAPACVHIPVSGASQAVAAPSSWGQSRAVVSDGTRLVALGTGASGSCAVSDDGGLSWTDVSAAPAAFSGGSAYPCYGAYVGGKYLFWDGGSARVMYASTNRVDWTATSLVMPAGAWTFSPRAFVHDGSRFVALYNGWLCTSVDAFVWEWTAAPAGAKHLVYTGGVFALFGDAAGGELPVFLSADLQEWEAGSIPVTSFTTVGAAACGGGRVVLVEVADAGSAYEEYVGETSLVMQLAPYTPPPTVFWTGLKGAYEAL